MASHVPECGVVTSEATLVRIGPAKAIDSLGENNTERRGRPSQTLRHRIEGQNRYLSRNIPQAAMDPIRYLDQWSLMITPMRLNKLNKL